MNISELETQIFNEAYREFQEDILKAEAQIKLSIDTLLEKYNLKPYQIDLGTESASSVLAASSSIPKIVFVANAYTKEAIKKDAVKKFLDKVKERREYLDNFVDTTRVEGGNETTP